MRFFVLESGLGAGQAVVAPVDPKYKEALTCPACARPLSGKEWIAPLQAEVDARKADLTDLIFLSGLDMLVSSRFLDAWRTEKCSGLFGLREVQILGVKPKKKTPKKGEKYFLALGSYGMTQIDTRKSRIEREGEADCLQCMGGSTLKAIGGFSVNEATWSGEDVFVAWGLGDRLIATERVLALQEKYGFTNMRLVPTEEWTWDPEGRLGK